MTRGETLTLRWGNPRHATLTKATGKHLLFISAKVLSTPGRIQIPPGAPIYTRETQKPRKQPTILVLFGKYLRSLVCNVILWNIILILCKSVLAPVWDLAIWIQRNPKHVHCFYHMPFKWKGSNVNKAVPPFKTKCVKDTLHYSGCRLPRALVYWTLSSWRGGIGGGTAGPGHPSAGGRQASPRLCGRRDRNLFPRNPTHPSSRKSVTTFLGSPQSLLNSSYSWDSTTAGSQARTPRTQTENENPRWGSTRKKTSAQALELRSIFQIFFRHIISINPLA